jgi:hypothetical protein
MHKKSEWLTIRRARRSRFTDGLSIRTRAVGARRRGWGLTVTLTAHNETLLTGPVADQAALYGLLKKVRDLGAPLLSLNCLNPSPTDETEAADIRQ